MRVRLRDSRRETAGSGRMVHLSAECEYLVVGYDDQYYRVVNDRNEPILYRRNMFEVVSAREPACWVRTEGGDGDYYVDPPECAAPGFYENLFDGDPKAKQVFDEVRRRLELDDPPRKE
jgi:hypothetical protein